MQSFFATHWHHLPISEVLALLETDADKGLDTFEVVARQQHFGPNDLTLQKKQNPVYRFFVTASPAVDLYLACFSAHNSHLAGMGGYGSNPCGGTAQRYDWIYAGGKSP